MSYFALLAPLTAEPNQWLQIPGAVLVLVAYFLLQLRYLTAKSRVFALMNAVGAGLMALDAWRTDQYGFLILEGTWSLISAVSLVVILVHGRRAQ